MVLLILFGFVAGAATAVSPCVLPVLPIALSAGATGGRRRPLGIVVGLAVSFTFATVALVYVIAALGLPGDLLRNIAIVVLIGFGLIADDAAPRGPGRGLAEPLRAAGPGSSRGRRRLLVGDGGRRQPRPRLRALRRADPRRRDHRLRLAAVHRRAASRWRSATGSARPPVLYLLMLGGRRLVAPLARRGPGLQIAMGAVMVVVALAMLGELRHRVPEPDRQRPAQLPRQPDRRRSRSTASARAALGDVRGEEAHGIGGRGSRGRRRTPTRARPAAASTDLPVLGTAPEFVGNQRVVQHARGAAADAARRCAAASSWSTSGPTAASTACARSPT